MSCRRAKLPADPQFIEEVRDVAGLYLTPPQDALVLCVDEKSQIQASGPVIAQHYRRHRHQEFPRFLRLIDAAVPAGLDLHLVLDGYANRKTPEIHT